VNKFNVFRALGSDEREAAVSSEAGLSPVRFVA
jgi:hypothetical protein